MTREAPDPRPARKSTVAVAKPGLKALVATRSLVSSAGRRATERPPAGDDRADAEQRRHLIASEAYLRAERRGFVGGSPEQDWLEAEAEVDRRLREGAR